MYRPLWITLPTAPEGGEAVGGEAVGGASEPAPQETEKGATPS